MTFIIIIYGIAVVVESIVAFTKSVTAADIMWYICRVFGIPFPLKIALIIRALLLITGGWALISSFKNIIDVI